MTHKIETAIPVADDADSSLLAVKFSEMKDHGNISNLHKCDEHFLAYDGVFKEAMNDADFDVTKPPQPAGFTISASDLEK